MIMAKPKPKRRNRTIVLPLGPTLKEYNALISTEEGMKQLIRRVEIADHLNWGHQRMDTSQAPLDNTDSLITMATRAG